MKRPFLRSRDPSITPDVLQRWIELMVETAEGQRDLSEEELSQALVRQGVPPLTAVRLVVLVPVAFGDFLLSEMGAGVTPSIGLVSKSGKVSKVTLLTNFAEYRAAAELASGLRAREGFENLAESSAQLRAVRQLISRGSDPRNIRLAPGTTFVDIF